MTISEDSQSEANKSDIDFPPKTSDDFFRRGLKNAQLGILDKAASDFEEAAWLDPENHEVPVSYTHLTLPTIYSV